ncbi:tape measure protein [Pseudactinotalea sp. Z1732]|uniref:tape measure protein n=2 Tax=Actinomycetes TaxID=1760 RepID=UPI003C7E544D
MSTRSIAVRLRAEVTDFNREISSAASSLDQVVKKSGEGERAADTFAGRVAQSARLQRQEWTTVGSTLVGVGAAVTGLGAAVLHTGIQYNTLRQTATAGLTTMLGSAEAAAAQMDRLDHFASTSPFARQVWITAQQQLIGFGVEAGRVIPILDGVQDAVAAVGGSNSDIESIVYALAQMQSQGRLTGQTLNQVGQYGIDMATILGEQMGVSGQEIRNMAMKPGGIPVEQIWDPLVAGLNENFGGAAANVRETFEGAVDRVKAAWRDLSATIAAPLVDPEGGGALITWLNSLADAMRLFMRLPDGLIQTGAALTGLGGVATLTAGSLLLAVPRIVEFRTSLETLARSFPVWSRAIGGFTGAIARLAGVGVVIAGVTAAVGALSAAVHDPGIPRDMEDIARSMQRIYHAGDDLANLQMDQIFSQMATWGFDRVTIESNNLGEALERLANPSLAGSISAFFGSFGIPSWMKDTEVAVAETDAALAHLVDSGHGDMVRVLLEGLGLSAEQLSELMPQATGALMALDDAAEMARGGISEADAALAEMRQGWIENQEAARELREAWREMAISASQSFGDVMDAYDSASAAAKEFSEDATASAQDWIAALSAQIDAHNNWESNIIGATERARDLLPRHMWDAADEMVDALIAGGMDSAEAAALLVSMTDDEFVELAGLARDRGEQGGEAFADGVESARRPGVDIDDMPARSGFEALVDDFSNTTTDTNLDVDPRPAIAEALALMGDWEGTTTDTMLSADPGPAVKIFNEQTGAWERTTTETLLDLNENRAVQVFNRETGRWERTTTRTLLDANDSPARATVRGLGGWAGQQTYRVNIDANVAAAQARIRQLNNQRVQVGADLMRASGGPVFGPGSETSDSIAARLSHNEHVWSAAEVRGAGGHAAMEQMRAWARAGVRGFAGGGTPAYQAAPQVIQVAAPAPTEPRSISGPLVHVERLGGADLSQVEAAFKWQMVGAL